MQSKAIISQMRHPFFRKSKLGIETDIMLLAKKHYLLFVLKSIYYLIKKFCANSFPLKLRQNCKRKDNQVLSVSVKMLHLFHQLVAEIFLVYAAAVHHGGYLVFMFC